MDIFKTIIVKAIDVDAARLTCATVQGGQGMLTAALTTDPAGNPPATHYASSGLMPEEIFALMWPSSADVSSDTWQDACARLGLVQVQEPL